METAELKRCPFCGGEAALATWRDERNRLNPSAVRCTDCGARTEVYNRKREAIEAWNYRP